MDRTVGGTRPIERLLVPIDVSADTERAMRPALRIARRAGASVTLFSWSRDEARAPEIKAYLSELATELPEVTVEVAVSSDPNPAPAIAFAAERGEATVCMATHGRSGVGHALLGSVAEETLRLLERPCLLVGPSVIEGPLPWHTSLVASVDGGRWSEAVVPVAKAWADQLTLPLLLVHVREPDAAFGTLDRSLEEMERGYLDEVAARVDPDAPPRGELLYGEPARAIASFATSGAELVAMATHGRSGLGRTVLGSVAMSVVHHSQRPVLVVPSKRLA